MSENNILHQGEPEGWKSWNSIKEKDRETIQYVSAVWKNVFLYGNLLRCYGFLTKEHVLTPALYTPNYRMLYPESGTLAITSIVKGPNSWEILRLKDMKKLISGISCYIILDENRLAYRMDEQDVPWPHNMKWGVLNVHTGKTILEPQLLPEQEEGKPYLSVRERILKLL